MPSVEPPYSERFLYEESFDRFQTGTNSRGCGPIEYALVGLPSETFAISDPRVPGALDIRTMPQSRDELGTFDYYIEGCITFPSDGSRVCGRTNDLAIKVADPCAHTVPLTDPIKVLSAPRLKADSDYIAWPPADSVDAASPAYGEAKCGPKTLRIYDAASGLAVPFLSFDAASGAIALEPALSAPTGLRDYFYEVTMVNYPGQTARQPFQAEVTICEVDRIDSGDGFINDRQTMWGDDAITVEATDAVNAFTQFPACGYPIYVKPRVERNGERTLLPIPNSAVFVEEPNRYYFEIQKCSQAAYPLDPDCGSVDPYQLVYPIILEACVIDGPVPVVNDEVRFSVEIGNTCELDSLTINPRGLVQYFLRTPSQPHSDKITVVQTYDFCPFECTFNQNEFGVMKPYNRDIFQSWNAATGQFIINTSDKSLGDTMMFMVVTCRSTLSTS